MLYYYINNVYYLYVLLFTIHYRKHKKIQSFIYQPKILVSQKEQAQALFNRKNSIFKAFYKQIHSAPDCHIIGNGKEKVRV